MTFVLKILKKIWIAITTVFFIFSISIIIFDSKNVSSVIYSTKGSGYITGAVIARVPEGGGIVFSRTQITLEVGESAYIQWSVADKEKRQHNLQMSLLYDVDKIKIEQNYDGMAKITALKEGETEINTFTNKEFIDIAYVKILPEKNESNNE
jgi:hypothetical protein